jgi:hypothetical protein
MLLSMLLIIMLRAMLLVLMIQLPFNGKDVSADEDTVDDDLLLILLLLLPYSP